VRTLVVSDLHLGTAGGRDILGRGAPLDDLLSHVRHADRLVLLGDVLELRHGPLRDALTAAEPVIAALGEALPDAAELLLVPGNHDHQLVQPWLEQRGRRHEPAPLGLEERAGATASPAVQRLAQVAGPARLDVAYPGVWLREDVYAHHGHYLDRLTTIPTFERLAAGAMARVTGSLPADRADPDDFEAGLAPIYAWLHAVAQGGGARWSDRRQGVSAGAWRTLTATGPRPLRARAFAAAFPLAVGGLNRAGLGPVRPHLSGQELRRASLRAMGEVVRLLGVRAEHVIFGHTHRAGPLPSDPLMEWRAPTGASLHNPGSWIDEPAFAHGDEASPYYAGRGIWLDDDAPPRLERLSARLS
jgi:hypothetical protein